MAGLVAAARVRELGAEVVVLEKGDRYGGSMLLSSGVIWRHRSLAEFREECPGGDPVLQRRLIDELDEGLDWLESLGAEVTERATGNPRTIGRRFDPRRLTDALVRTAGDVRLGRPFDEADVLATGGFGARLARERGLLLRASRWSEGDGLAYGLAQGAELTAGMDEFYGRNLPAAVPEELFVSASQVYGAHALVLDEQGREFFHERGLVVGDGSRSGDRTAARVRRRGTSSMRGHCGGGCASERWRRSWRSRGRSAATCDRPTSSPSRCPRRRSSWSRRFSRCA